MPDAKDYALLFLPSIKEFISLQNKKCCQKAFDSWYDTIQKFFNNF